MARLTMLAVLSLVVVMLAGGAAAGKTPWLADVLAAKPGPSSDVAAAAQHYAELIHERVSLPILKGDGCDCVSSNGPCTPDALAASQIFSQTLGCPTKEERAYDKHTASGSFSTNFASSTGVASCTYQLSYVAGDIGELAPGVPVIGTVSFICDFNGGADKCDSPVCDGMTITGYGRVVEITNNAANTKVYYTSWGSPEGMDIGCGAYVRQGARKSAAGKRAEAAVSTASYYYDDEADALYYPAGASQLANVLIGTFTAVSAHSPTKFTSGRIQSVAPIFNATVPAAPTPVTSLPAGALVLTPWTVDLEFIGKDY